jgi:hypothetical protein
MILNKILRIENFLPFYLVCCQYSLFSTTIGDILLILISLITLIREKNYNFIFKYSFYHLLWIYIIIKDVYLIFYGYGEISISIHRICFYTICFLSLLIFKTSHIDKNVLYNSYKVAFIVYSIGLIYHFILIFVFNKSVTTINIFPGYEIGTFTYRPKSFFIEPASFANSVLPFLSLTLLHKEIKTSIWVTFIILLSTSTVGVILSTVLWLHYLYNENKYKDKIKIVIIFISILYIYLSISIFSSSLNKFLKVTKGEDTFGGRVITGFEVVKSQSLREYILGTNYITVNDYIKNNLGRFNTNSKVIFYYNIKNYVYVSTVGQIINKYGFCGIILFFLPLYIFLRNDMCKLKSYIIILPLSSLGQFMVFNGYYFMSNILISIYTTNDKTISNPIN